MPARNSRRESDKVVRIGPAKDGSGGLGSMGVDLFTEEGQLSDFALRQGDRVRSESGALVRAPGSKRLAVLTNSTASRTFNSDAKYATFTPSLIPTGGFAIEVHFTAQFAEVPSGAIGWVVGARPNGQTYHVFKVTNQDNGTVVVSWRTSGGATHSITISGVANGTACHLLAVYDAVAGTFTCYLNGVSSGTPITGLASTLQPVQTAGVVWTFGVEKETGVGVTAGSAFPNAIDGMTIFTLRGVNPSSGDPSLLDTLKKHQFRAWPNPAMPMVLAHYDMDEASGTTMYDRSRYKNHGTYVGGPSVTAPVALSFPVGNYAGTFQTATGSRTNLFAAGGALFSQVVRTA